MSADQGREHNGITETHRLPKEIHMNKFAFAALAVAASAAITGPALAQATGSVDVNGTVSARCSAASPISGNITLGELSKADGKVDAAFAGNTGGLSRNFTVVCNGASPRLSVNALPLVNAASANPPTGYTNTVHYTATLSAMNASGGTTNVANQSSTTGATTGNVSGRLAAVQNNISLTVGSGITGDSNAMLEAGAYAGRIEVVVSPTA
jgi:hypothetical protein